MRTVKVEFYVEIPEAATDEQIEEWLRFSLRDGASMDCDNPLAAHEPAPIFGTFDWS